MKIIVSHDIDHLKVSEHFGDLIIPKHLVRNTIELTKGIISFKEYYLRYKLLFVNKWQNLHELMQFNNQNNIPATFFIGVNNGLGLNYKIGNAEKWIYEILKKSFDCGVHGIEHLNQQGVNKEWLTFQQISKNNNFGIRMHYLRKDTKTLELLSNAGYLFDSSMYELKSPYKINSMWEFPLHIMDGYELEAGKKWQSISAYKALESTKRKIDDAYKLNLPYLTLLFHDRYYSNAFYDWKLWYELSIKYLIDNGFDFISYKDAINELEK